MFSKLNKLLPTLKQRLIVTFVTLLSILIGIIFFITDYSIQEELQEQVVEALEENILFFAEEYNEEFEDYFEDEEEDDDNNEEEEFNEQRFHRYSKKALRNLRQEIRENNDILVEKQQWLFLFDQKKKLITSSQSDFLPVSQQEILSQVNPLSDLHSAKTKQLKNNFKFTYIIEELADDKYLLLAINNQEIDQLILTFRTRFLLAYLAIIVVVIFLCSKIIQQSLIGFQQVRETADNIAEGQYDQRVQIAENSAQEVTELSQSFNTMIDRTETLIKEIKDVTNNVAHDLRTPLTRIRGKVETSLMAQADLATHQELSGLVIEECDHLMLLIDNMLTLAEYESGLVPQKQESINLKNMLNELISVFDSVTEDKTITINTDFPQNDIFIQGDPSKLQRAFANLLDNSIKYSPKNSNINIILKNDDHLVTVQFTDQGIGISQEDQKRIFERFYRVDSSRTNKGNGLGLNLAKAFIENHQGSLKVESRINQGSTFSVTLHKKS